MNKKHEHSPDDTSFTFNQAQLQGFAIGLLLFIIFVFIAGYFWGKKSSQEELIKNYEQESFADKIYTSLCSLCENEEEDKIEKLEEGSEE